MSWERRFVRLMFGAFVLAVIGLLAVAAAYVSVLLNKWTALVIGALALAYAIGWLFDWLEDPEDDGLGGKP